MVRLISTTFLEYHEQFTGDTQLSGTAVNLNISMATF